MRVSCIHASQGVAAAATTVSRRWSHDQATALREAALVRLHALAPLCPEVFLSEDGPATLLRLLSAGVAPAHVEAALRQLHRLVESAAEMAEALGMAGVVAPLLGLLQDASMQVRGSNNFCKSCPDAGHNSVGVGSVGVCGWWVWGEEGGGHMCWR
jgi:hypothetical protein